MAVPFTGSFLLVAMLVIGVAVPTPAAVGGFHEALRVGVTMFFGAPDRRRRRCRDRPPRLQHRCPSLLLGLAFAAQEGLNFSRMRQLADTAEPSRTPSP